MIRLGDADFENPICGLEESGQSKEIYIISGLRAVCDGNREDYGGNYKSQGQESKGKLQPTSRDILSET
ncbi:unnamed protein product [Linum trigynum]